MRDGLPHRALGHLRIAAQDPDAVGNLVQVLAGQRDPDAYGEPLPEGARGHVHPRDGGRRVALKAASELSERQEVLLRDRARRLVHRVQQRRGVAFGKDQMVIGGVVRIVEVVT